jgi:glycosyltransferase involved in cell wall biosynthesis
MPDPLISVIIPSYNHAAFLSEAVDSVLRQREPRFEAIIVDDGSTDGTRQAAARYTAGPHKDERVRYIHQENQGLPAARNTGIKAARGAYLAFLDADDRYHPEKLARQLACLLAQPQAGLCYASRLEIDQDGQPLWLVRAPARVGLKDLLLGFPFTINDILVRREWVKRNAAFDTAYRLHGEDRIFYLRLALDGCGFAGVPQALAERRLHGRRVFTRIPERIEIMLRALETAFTDRRCPAEARLLRSQAQSRIWIDWAWQALSQGETAPGQEYIRRALALAPELGESGGAALLNGILWFSLRSGGEHAALLESMVAQLPEPFKAQISGATAACAIAGGYLVRGARALMWRSPAEGQALLAQAAERRQAGKFAFPPAQLRIVVDELIAYRDEQGGERADAVVEGVAAGLSRAGDPASARWIVSRAALHQAFERYQAGDFGGVAAPAWRAVRADPRHLLNRGVISITLRALLRRPFQRTP